MCLRAGVARQLSSFASSAKSLNTSLTYAQRPSEVHFIPDDQASWTDKEISPEPSDFDEANAKVLAKEGLAAAIGKEEEDKLEEGIAASRAQAQFFQESKAAHLPPTLSLPHLLATFRPVPILPPELMAGIGPSTCPVLASNRLSSSTECETVVSTPDSFTSSPASTPRVDSVTVGDPFLKRGPCRVVPAPVWPAVFRVRSMCAAIVDVDFEEIELSAISDVNPPRIATPAFDHFLSPDKVTTWDEQDNNEPPRRYEEVLATLTFKGLSPVKQHVMQAAHRVVICHDEEMPMGQR
jgi:hypothetical protein